MDLYLKRIARRENYTIGRLYIDGEYFCDTLEDKDRGLSQNAPYAANKRRKVAGKTAIPTGRYQVTLNVRSTKYKSRKQYQFCKGFVPRLLDVPCFEGILIHIGNYPEDTEGCILVGRNKQVGAVLESADTFHRLYRKLQTAKGMIFIKIE